MACDVIIDHRIRKQCCGSEFIFFRIRIRIRIHKFFPDSNSDSVSDSDSNSDLVSDSDPYSNILTRIFFKWCLSLLLYVFWNLYDREKSFPTEKLTFFLSSVLYAIFHKNYYFTQCLDPNSNPNPNFFSDSDPAKIFGFFRIRIWIHNTVRKLMRFVQVLT
jgi:hypothetical protein